MMFFQVVFNNWVTQYWFCLFRFYFLCNFRYFFFNLANTFSHHDLKFEVYLVLSVMGSRHVSRAVVVSINALEKFILWQKQSFIGLLKKWCSENMQQIYRRTLMPNCDFNKVALQLYWNCTSAWMFSCKFAAYF